MLIGLLAAGLKAAGGVDGVSASQYSTVHSVADRADGGVNERIRRLQRDAPASPTVQYVHHAQDGLGTIR